MSLTGGILAHTFVLGVRDQVTRSKELADSASQSTARAAQKVEGLSHKLLDTSANLAGLNATLQETQGLLRDSTVTSMSSCLRV